ncbi:MAG: transposase [Armatimonadetes bacterium]|nr:transposase [Armatimonadota bacterium]
MPQSLSQIVVHAVFSTKDRTPWLDEALRPALFAYIATVIKSDGHVPIMVGGHDDHVHILFGLARTVPIADMIKKTKVTSSVWIKSEFPHRSNFAWQGGYGAFSVSYPSIDAAIAYIANQDQHHQKLSFPEEFRRLMDENGIAFDEKYVWD